MAHLGALLELSIYAHKHTKIAACMFGVEVQMATSATCPN